MNSPNDLDRLADLAGIESEYWDIWGAHHPISEYSKRAILRLLGFPAANDLEIANSLQKLEDEHWQRTMPPVLVVRRDEPIVLPLVIGDIHLGQSLTVTVEEEDGKKHRISVVPASGSATEEYWLGDSRRLKIEVTVPERLPLGYHRVRCDAASAETTRLIVAPFKAYLPPPLENGDKLWGISTQLYALKREASWGIGDFQDLNELVATAGTLGASVVGINPLHTLFSREPERASPYQPSSRLFINPLYIDVTAIPEFEASAAARRKADDMAAALAECRAGDSVSYAKVTNLKWSALETAYAEFRSRHLATNDLRAAEFQAFCKRDAEQLRRFALFEALSEKFRPRPWQEWPEAYRDPGSDAVAAFEREQAARIDFYRYLQWIADVQLNAVAQKPSDLRMVIGLYRDLAIGSAYDGSDTWSNQDVFAVDASTGCPPDPFNMLGQDWEIPPLNPHALRRSAYDLFISVIRANMRHAGALRIDHVMGLLHLFWVPKGDTPAHGAYVKYPFDDLMAIVALESHRNSCLVIGEDLGTVPEGFRERMAEANILSYRVLYFEKEGDRFKSPAEYPRLALACVTTHDLATLQGFWEDLDIDLKHRLSLYPSPDADTDERQGRQHDRYLLLRALEGEGLLPNNRDPEDADAIGMDAALNVAIHRYVAQSPASIVLVQIDDLMSENDQINLPGTVDERPNWRRRLSQPTQDLAEMPMVKALREALSARGTTSR